MELHRIALSIPYDVGCALLKVQDCCGGAIVAGGSLRDTFFRVPFNDVDVFAASDFDGVMLQRKLGPDWSVFERWGQNSSTNAEDYEECFGVHMPSIWEATQAGEHPIQIMVWPNVIAAADIIGTFDFGFNQIAFDGATTWCTDAFLRDAADNTATFLKGAEYRRLQRCHARAMRIGERHPTRRFIWPPGAGPADIPELASTETIEF